MRIACVLAAHLPVQIERGERGVDGPLVVGGRPWDDRAVLDCCPAALAAGVRMGMPLARAERLCPRATFVPAREAVYRDAHALLEAAIRRHTDRVETAGLGYFYADFSDLYIPTNRAPDDAEADLLRLLARDLRDATALDARVGLAAHRFTAEQAARAAQPHSGYRVPQRHARTFLASLPLSTLPVDAEMLRRCHVLGIDTLGTLARLPRVAVVRQFGTDAGLFHDLASGRDPRRVYPDAPPLVLELRTLFEPPVRELGRLIVRTAQLGESLGTKLAAGQHQAQGMTLTLEDEAGRIQMARTAVKPPTADVERLKRYAAGLVQRVTLGRAVEGATLTLYPLRPSYLAATQLELFTAPTDARRRRLNETLRRLRQRFGELAIIVAALLAPPGPRPIQATTNPQGKPAALAWDQRLHPVAKIYDAWYVSRFWWRKPVRRTYYRVELQDGRVKVVFRDLEEDTWYLTRRH